MDSGGLSAGWRRIAGPYTVLRVSGQGLEFLAFVVFARSLGTAEFGVLSVGYLVARYAALVADWGVSVRGPRDVVHASEDTITMLVRHRERVSTILTLAFAAGCLAIGRPSLMPLGALVVAGGVSRDWIALGRESGARSAAPSVVRGAVVLIGAFFASALLGASCALAAGAAMGAAFSVGLNRISRESSAGTRLVDPWILIATLMAQIYISVDVVLLAVMRSDSQAGIYAAVYRLPNAWVTVNGLLVAALLPVATRQLARDRTKLRALVARDWRVGSAFGGLLILVSPIAALLVTPLFGEAFGSGKVPVMLLCVATGISTVTSLLGTTYLVVGSDAALAGALSAGAVLNVLLNLIVIPPWGMIGAAIATICSEALVLAVIATMLHRMVRAQAKIT